MPPIPSTPSVSSVASMPSPDGGLRARCGWPGRDIRGIIPSDMDEREFYDLLLWAWVALAVAVFGVLLRTPAPYGRLARLGWMLMECPAVPTVAWMFAAGDRRSAPAWAFLALWNLHFASASCPTAASR